MTDSLCVANPAPLVGAHIQSTCEWINLASEIAMIVIAVINIVLTIYIYKMNHKHESNSDSQNRKFELMLVLILNSNINRLYKFYDDVTIECRKLIISNNMTTKQEVNQKIIEALKIFRLDFVTLFNVINPGLYKTLLSIADKLIDGITNAIFDEGINLTHEPKFDEVIYQTISKSRTDFLAAIYNLQDN